MGVTEPPPFTDWKHAYTDQLHMGMFEFSPGLSSGQYEVTFLRPMKTDKPIVLISIAGMFSGGGPTTCHIRTFGQSKTGFKIQTNSDTIMPTLLRVSWTAYA